MKANKITKTTTTTNIYQHQFSNKVVVLHSQQGVLFVID